MIERHDEHSAGRGRADHEQRRVGLEALRRYTHGTLDLERISQPTPEPSEEQRGDDSHDETAGRPDAHREKR